MPGIARVIVDLALDREFDYRIPERLADAVAVGVRVSVPFGRRQALGYVVGLPDKSERAELKEITALASQKPLVDSGMLALARWMGEYYLARVEQAVRTVLPAAVRRTGARFKQRLVVSLAGTEGGEQKSEGGGQKSEDRGQKSEGGEQKAEDRGQKSEGSGQKSEGSGQKSEGSGQKSEGSGQKSEGGEQKAEDRGEKSEGGEPQKGKRPTAKQEAILAWLRTRGKAFLHELTAELRVTPAPVRSLARAGRVRIEPAPEERVPLSRRSMVPTQPLSPTAEQAAALEVIRQCVDRTEGEMRIADCGLQIAGIEKRGTVEPGNRRNGDKGSGGVVLLHGVTGSGKTEVYLQSIAHVLTQGRGAIVLVPEIALTPQTVDRFVGRFGDRVAVLHSQLSDGERHDEWHRIRDGRADIVIGARSAVFAPVRRLGLIVVDEEHEPTYKQEEPPRYHARDVAVMRGWMEKCPVVLGSATPSLESWANARKGKYRLVSLRSRVDNRRMPAMRIVDLRLQRGRGGGGIFSEELLLAIRQRLDRGEQTILFLNRRGFATSVLCPKCGFVAACDLCSVAYTFHQSDGRMRCHICGGAKEVPARCPSCGDLAFKFAGVGTQRVEATVRKLFPRARVQRMDSDVTTRKDSYDRILGEFRTGKTDILIGTQMIAKGLHFPNVTLVGVIHADLSLHMPDFRAGERTFQLLAQVAGRAGRGEVAGEVIVQTFTPFHAAVQAARRLDYESFCDQELEFRRELLYPPFSRLVCVTLRSRSDAKASFHASTLWRRLRERLPAGVRLAEPSPAPLAKAKGFYRHQILLRSPAVRRMTAPLQAVLRDFPVSRDVVLSVDVDAVNLM